MERNYSSENTQSLVRKITEERERFVSAWQHGAESRELNQIRQNIQQLNDLLWDATTPADRSTEIHRSGRTNERESHTRTGPNRTN